jgi:hypothetical protein
MRRILVACIALLFMTGCNTQKRDIKRLDAYFLQYTTESARLSNLVYPCFKGILKSDTVIVNGRPDTVIKFSGIRVDSVKHDTVFATKTQTKTVTSTVIKTVIDTVQDFRAIASLNDQIKTQRDSVVIYKTQVEQVKHQRNTWTIVGVCACALILIFIVAKVIIFFYGGAAGSVISKI